MKKLVYLLVILPVLNLFSISLAQEKIDFMRYSVVCPDGEWTIASKDEDNQVVGLEKIKSKRENSQIIITYVPVTEPSLWELNEEQSANNFIANEKQIMIELGVKKGLYKLVNVKEWTDIVNSKKFYTMSYQNITGNYTVEGLLYVYVPPAEKHKELLAIVFTQGHLKNKPYTNDIEEFIKVVKSLEMK